MGINVVVEIRTYGKCYCLVYSFVRSFVANNERKYKRLKTQTRALIVVESLCLKSFLRCDNHGFAQGVANTCTQLSWPQKGITM